MSDCKSVVHAVDAAQTYAVGTLQRGSYLSLPMPCRSEGGPSFRFLLGRGEVQDPDTGYVVWPPAYVATVDARTARFIELRAVGPNDFGQRTSAGGPIGPGVAPALKLEPPYVEQLAVWYQAVDLLIPHFLGPAVSDEPREAITAFLDGFERLAEPALRPYYEHIGSHFFDWIVQGHANT